MPTQAPPRSGNQPLTSAAFHLFTIAAVGLSLLFSHGLAAEPSTALEGQWIPFEGVSWGCNRRIDALATAPDGRIYVGGSFTSCGRAAANNIAIYDPATDEYSSLGEGPDNGVMSNVRVIELVGEQVFVAGSISSAGGTAISDIAIWDGETWQATGNNVSFQGTVSALHWKDGRLYAGGSFTNVRQNGQNIPANRIAVWEDGVWSALGDGLNGSVSAISSWQDLIVIGGRFSDADGVTANNVVAWNGQTFLPLAGPDGEGVTSSQSTIDVSALGSNEAGVFVAGQFQLAGGQPARNVAFWNGASWTALAAGGLDGVNGSVLALDVQGSVLTVAGGFNNAAGVSVGRAASWDGNSWQSLGSPGSGIPNDRVRAIARHGSTLFFGGDFDRTTAGPANRAARFNSADGWQAMGRGGFDGIGGEVKTIIADGNSIFIGGDFTTAGDVLTRNIARWDGNDWHELVPGGIPGPVEALLIDQDGSLIIGGNFLIPGSPTLRNAVRWSGSELMPINPQVAGFNATVRDFSIDQDEVCAVGSFTRINTNSGPIEANHVACWNDGTWQALGVGVTTTLQTVTHFDGQLYVAGAVLSSAGGQPVKGIARWDGNHWLPLGTPPNDGLFSGSVFDLLATSSSLVVVGSFWRINSLPGENQRGIAGWDGSQWLADPAQLNLTVTSAAPFRQGLVAAGFFSATTDLFPTRLNRVGYWNGEIWKSLGPVDAESGGVSVGINVVATAQDRVWVGGLFNLAGDRPSAGLAVFVPPRIFSDRFEEADD